MTNQRNSDRSHPKFLNKFHLQNLDQMRQLGEDLRTDEEMESERADGVASKKIKIDRSKPNAFLAIQVFVTFTVSLTHTYID